VRLALLGHLVTVEGGGYRFGGARGPEEDGADGAGEYGRAVDGDEEQEGGVRFEGVGERDEQYDHHGAADAGGGAAEHAEERSADDGDDVAWLDDVKQGG
jgi:hypothetical protein